MYRGRELEVGLVFTENCSGSDHQISVIHSGFLENLTAEGELDFIRSSFGKWMKDGICVGLCIDGPSKHTGWRNGLVAKLNMTESATICKPHTGDLTKQHLSKSNTDISAVVSLLKVVSNDLNDFYKKRVMSKILKLCIPNILNILV